MDRFNTPHVPHPRRPTETLAVVIVVVLVVVCGAYVLKAVAHNIKCHKSVTACVTPSESPSPSVRR